MIRIIVKVTETTTSISDPDCFGFVEETKETSREIIARSSSYSDAHIIDEENMASYEWAHEQISGKPVYADVSTMSMDYVGATRTWFQIEQVEG